MSALNFPMVNVAQLFREQCQLSPNHIAICCKNEQISYQQLDWLSNQLALYLIESGVKAYDLIGVYLDSSIIMVAGLLAILKVGAAYLPLDKNDLSSNSSTPCLRDIISSTRSNHGKKRIHKRVQN